MPSTLPSAPGHRCCLNRSPASFEVPLRLPPRTALFPPALPLRTEYFHPVRSDKPAHLPHTTVLPNLPPPSAHPRTSPYGRLRQTWHHRIVPVRAPAYFPPACADAPAFAPRVSAHGASPPARSAPTDRSDPGAKTGRYASLPSFPQTRPARSEWHPHTVPQDYRAPACVSAPQKCAAARAPSPFPPYRNRRAGSSLFSALERHEKSAPQSPVQECPVHARRNRGCPAGPEQVSPRDNPAASLRILPPVSPAGTCRCDTTHAPEQYRASAVFLNFLREKNAYSFLSMKTSRSPAPASIPSTLIRNTTPMMEKTMRNI